MYPAWKTGTEIQGGAQLHVFHKPHRPEPEPAAEHAGNAKVVSHHNNPPEHLMGNKGVYPPLFQGDPQVPVCLQTQGREGMGREKGKLIPSISAPSAADRARTL